MYTDTNSTTYCGCDPGANHLCARHTLRQAIQSIPETPLSEGLNNTDPLNAIAGGLSSRALHVDPFVVKDSGKRTVFDSGMVRDTEEGKIDYTLVFDGPMLERWAVHLTKGSIKYEPRNWMKAQGEEEYERFRKSALRHFIQWMRGDRDEDHAAAVLFNINGAEFVRGKNGGD